MILLFIFFDVKVMSCISWCKVSVPEKKKHKKNKKQIVIVVLENSTPKHSFCKCYMVHKAFCLLIFM